MYIFNNNNYKLLGEIKFYIFLLLICYKIYENQNRIKYMFYFEVNNWKHLSSPVCEQYLKFFSFSPLPLNIVTYLN